MQKVVIKKTRKQVPKMTIQEQLSLLERLVHQLQKDTLTEKKKINWDKLYGAGKGLWGDEDAQEYVDTLREDRV